MTVQVTDASSGAGGTATIQFTTPAIPAPGHQTQPGGNQPTQSKSPAGSDNGKHSEHPTGRTGAKHVGKHGQGPVGLNQADQTTTEPAASTTTTSDHHEHRRPARRRHDARPRPPSRAPAAAAAAA